jgi:hypothetical protein
MGARLKAAVAALAFSVSLLGGSGTILAADFPEQYGEAYPPARAYRSARPICVEERGPDAPPYGYGCIDRWVRIRNTHDVIQDNGYGYRMTTTTVRRRYPPQYFVPEYDVQTFYDDGGPIYVEPSPLGCPTCE